MAGVCEYRYESSGSIKGEEFLDRYVTTGIGLSKNTMTELLI